jgi:methionyl-tRNA formyltransferase
MLLFLGEEKNKIIDYLRVNEIDFIITKDKIDEKFIKDNEITFIISYRYRYLIKKDVISTGVPIVNLHISYLPFNRGADPNLWSFIENTKKGITIHYIDESLDTGDIIYQKEYFFDDEDTLSNSYNFLNDEIQNLFIENFNNILSGKCPRHKQPIEGTYHKSKDKEVIFEKINQYGGWNIKIGDLKKIL